MRKRNPTLYLWYSVNEKICWLQFARQHNLSREHDWWIKVPRLNNFDLILVDSYDIQYFQKFFEDPNDWLCWRRKLPIYWKALDQTNSDSIRTFLGQSQINFRFLSLWYKKFIFHLHECGPWLGRLHLELLIQQSHRPFDNITEYPNFKISHNSCDLLNIHILILIWFLWTWSF